MKPLLYAYINDTIQSQEVTKDPLYIECHHQKLMLIFVMSIVYILLLLFIVYIIQQHYIISEKNHASDEVQLESSCKVCNRSFNESWIPCDTIVCRNYKYKQYEAEIEGEISDDLEVDKAPESPEESMINKKRK